MKQLASLGEYANATQLAECLGLSRSGLYALRKRGQFPNGVRIGKARRWNVYDVAAWLAAQASSEEATA